MKKITFILLALISGTVFAQSDQATATADIVSPIAIDKTGDLSFGKVANNTTGKVTIAADGTVGGLNQIGNTAPKAALFDITAADGYSYSITIPTQIQKLTHTDGETTMNVDNFDYIFTTDGDTAEGTGSKQEISVGADLNVIATQKTGTYTGKFDVSVAYE